MKPSFEFTQQGAKVFKEMFESGEFSDIITGISIETDITKHPPKNLPMLKLEALEDRSVPELTIQFEYDYDTSGFFNSPDKKKTLQDAADDAAKQIFDEKDDPC